MMVNAWASFEVSEALNPFVQRHYAAGLNNTYEFRHRAKLTETYRKAVLKRSTQL